MREILFRGKRKDNGEWVYWNIYGELCRLSGKRARLAIPKTAGEHYYYYIYQIRQLIIPETVGQYTGLTDKNGKKIFEGDILKAENFIGVVKYNEVIASFIVEINDTTTEYIHWSPLNEGDPSRQLQLQYTEKLGNIHYNPELLKGGVDNG